MKRAARWTMPLIAFIAVALVIDSRGQAEKKEGGAVNRILGRKSGKTEPPPPAAEAPAQPAPVASESTATPGTSSDEVVEPRVVPVGGAEASASEPEAAAETPESATGFMSKEGGQVKIDLGSEADENNQIKDIKQDAELMETLKGATFIYEADGVADPMIFPPIRNEAIRNEMWLKHETILKDAGGDPTDGNTNQGIDSAKVKEAIDALNKILALNDSRFNEDTEAKIKQLEAYGPGSSRGVTTPGGDPVEVVGKPKALPKELELGPKGIVYNAAGEATCLLGDRLVKKGEVVPDFDYVRVINIEANKITLQCFTPAGATEDHEVPVADFENFSFWDNK